MATEKRPDVLHAVCECLDQDRFVDTRHVAERQDERAITRLEVLYVLRNGHHEKRKDQWENFYKAWNYAIRGKTFEKRDLRVVVSFDVNGMLIITAIEVGKKAGRLN